MTEIISGLASPFYVAGAGGTGYLAPFGVLERIGRHAFDKTLSRRDVVIACLDHDWSKQIATTADGTLRLYIAGDGLRFSIVGRLPAWTRFDQLRSRCRGASISFDILTYTMHGAEKEITDLRLRDITLCCARDPAYSATWVGIRGVDDDAATEIRRMKMCMHEWESN